MRGSQSRISHQAIIILALPFVLFNFLDFSILSRTRRMDQDGLISPPVVSSPEDHLSPSFLSKPVKRSRVSLACQRCKQRKQKCNGNQPSCSRCSRLNFECHYVIPSYPKPSQAKVYIKALEDRVAELETILTKGGDRTVSHDHLLEDLNGSEEGEIQPLLNAIRDLSLDIAGSYVGGASTMTLGRALESALAGKTDLLFQHESLRRDSTVRTESVASDTNSLQDMSTFQLSQINRDAAERMVNAYLGHLYTNFPIMYSFEVLDLHKRRCSLRNVYEESILNLIYGLGGHFLEKTGDLSKAYHPERHYEIALNNRETILRYGDSRSLTYLLLLGQHCLRMPKEPGAWTFTGLAMRMCIELGLHRRRRSAGPSLKAELNKRLFWSCYWWDREIAIAMGRPPSISDHDIDIDLPLDVDEANRDLNVLKAAAEVDRSVPAFPQTTMSCYIHLLRLKVIDSEIQHKIYRVDRVKSPETIYKTTDLILEKLYAWKAAIPPESTHWDPSDRQSFRGDEYRSYDSHMASYHKTIRVLLQPRLYEEKINKRYLALCAEACRAVCETYKRLHYRIPLIFTSVSLQTVFLAGLTLVYCMWQDTSNSNGFKSISALTDCSIILCVMTEKWSGGKKYRDLFEVVKKSVLDAIAEGKHIPRAAVTSMKDDMQDTLHGIQSDAVMKNIPDDLEQMISDMAGQPMFWDDVDMGFEMGMDTASFLVTGDGDSWDDSGHGNWMNSGLEEFDQAVS
ncbi:uncharacterized protein LY89DRAFT_676572 [Mollisia scopiformis]|uniref:Zn(2)-C6 fungal-type domain-containing protein n=1 Tax=Mollisia scopiformis TaxID=149040 RepID=A0A132B8C4_MOLSC|nr:uncharacterized protein LY89DRAFT_676572 [Mollisia scopiformis]KUJ08658.1 hypothetical protein LY89DRAFT_676572 [Mollisia scopiformis]